jgi:hypothetical protein
MEIRPLGPDMLHADGRADGQPDTTKLMMAFHNYAKTPENV